MTRTITVYAQVRLRIEVDEINLNYSADTEEIANTVMENTDYEFKYNEVGLRIAGTEIEGWEIIQ